MVKKNWFWVYLLMYLIKSIILIKLSLKIEINFLSVLLINYVMWKDTRIKFSTALMFTVIASLLIMGVLRVRSDPFSQSLLENFIKNYRNTVEFCSIFALFNFYTFTLAFVYSPAKNASNGKTKQLKHTFRELNLEKNRYLISEIFK